MTGMQLAYTTDTSDENNRYILLARKLNTGRYESMIAALGMVCEPVVGLRAGAFYGRGSTYPLKRFLNEGVPLPKIVGKPILLRKMAFL